MPFYIPLDKVFDINEFTKLSKYLSKIVLKGVKLSKQETNQPFTFWPMTPAKFFYLMDSMKEGMSRDVIRNYFLRNKKEDFSNILLLFYLFDYISFHTTTFEKTNDYHFVLLIEPSQYKKNNFASIGVTKLYYEDASESLSQVNEVYASIKLTILIANFLINIRKTKKVINFKAKMFIRFFIFKHRSNFFDNEISEIDFNFLKKATFEFKPFNYVEPYFDKHQQNINYFIEHLDVNFVSYLSNRGTLPVGYSIHNLETKYDYSFLIIWKKVNGLRFLVPNNDIGYKPYIFDTIKLYDNFLLDKLDAFGKGETDNFLFIHMKNDFLLNEFREYLFKYYKLSFTNIEADSIIENYKVLSKDSIIHISDNITDRQYTLLLDKLEEALNKDTIKIICYSSSIPKTKRYVSFINTKSTLIYNSKKEINRSKLFHAVLCKYSHEAILLQSNIIKLIEYDTFNDLINDEDIDYFVLNSAIKQLTKINFDYFSPTSWYYFREKYREHFNFENAFQKEINPKSIVYFKFSETSWKVDSDDLNIHENIDLVFITYFCIIYKYTIKTGYPISYTKLRLIQLYKQYDKCNDNVEKLKIRNAISKRIKEDHSINHSDEESFRSASKTFQNNYSVIGKFFFDLLDSKSVRRRIQFTENANRRFDFEIDGIEIEDFWFEENYKDLLKKKLI